MHQAVKQTPALGSGGEEEKRERGERFTQIEGFFRLIYPSVWSLSGFYTTSLIERDL